MNKLPERRPLAEQSFEALLNDVVDQASGLVDAQAKLQALIRATDELTSAPLELDLAAVLQRIAQSATSVVHARYGAAAVFGPDREVTQLAEVGVDEPAGASRIEVLIRIHGTVLGSIRLADAEAGSFSSDDVELLEALAVTAGVMISNARLYQDAAYRGTWSSALVETARILMAGDDDPIQLLLETVRGLGAADLVCMAMPDPVGDHTTLTHAVGLGSDTAIGMSFPTAGSLADTAIRRGEAVAVDDLHAHENYGHVEQALLGHTLVIPFAIGDGTSGVLSLARTRAHGKFDARDTEMAHSVAAHLGMVIAQERTREAHGRVALLEERERIARDLHDHVIQGLYATGLTLSAITNGLTDRRAAERLMAQVVEIDGAIAQIRDAIFTIRSPSEVVGDSLRSRIIEIVEHAAAGFDVSPTVAFRGPIALLADADLADDLAAVVREGLANAVRHGHARSASVLVGAEGGRISVAVDDDGTGVGDPVVLSGLANLRRRAEQRGGTLDVGPGTTGGTALLWSIPV